jgi:hypothetical protein
MKARVISHPFYFADSSEISISTELHAILGQASAADLKTLFQNFRLNFRSRIVGCTTTDDLLKLQGKIAAIDELEKYFLGILRSP